MVNIIHILPGHLVVLSSVISTNYNYPDAFQYRDCSTIKTNLSTNRLVIKSHEKGRPVSRVLSPPEYSGEPLSFILLRHHCRSHAAYPLRFPASAGIGTGSTTPNNRSRSIHGIATQKVYGWQCRHCHRWALTPPFHPSPDRYRGGYFLLHFYPLSGIFRLGSLAPCVARTFLSR